MTARSNPTETEKRLTELERENGQLKIAVAQLAHGLRTGVGWKPEYNGQDELVEVIEAARGHVDGQLERRPHRAPERRVKAAV